MRAASIQLAEHLERTQVMQSLSIVQDYMARHPSMFEDQALDMVQRWSLKIERAFNYQNLCLRERKQREN